ncbi:gliding motility-associated C-terminal domain-containing protein [Chitinophaga sancti]|uniref:T9SS type B sorting domain-containing protein n=1 Tax=Chitinophaga sancti TaxID=1004 RepID=UPI003F79AFB9
MKTQTQSTASVGNVYYFFIRAILILTIISPVCKTLTAQDIEIRNPSFEGPVDKALVPPEWLIGSKSPDTQPGINGVNKVASDGNTYVGAMHGSTWDETYGQKLSTPLKAGKIYTFSFDMAFAPFYFSNICFGSLGIYGGNCINCKEDTLWTSGVFYNTDWQRKVVTIRPRMDCDYLLFSPYLEGNCDSSFYSDVLVDNLSPTIKEVPQIEVSVSNACRSSNNGSVKVKVKGGKGPYKYDWNPGRYHDAAISHLASGRYTVKVTGANGISVEQEVVIGEYVVKATASLINSSCYNSDNGAIYMSASGGVVPYAFSIDENTGFVYNNRFTGLAAGTYNMRVRDAANCLVEVNNLSIKEPDELKIMAVTPTNISCNTLQNGSITLSVSGGSPAYTYEIIGSEPVQTDSVFRGLNEGKYRFRVTDDNQCYVEGEGEVSRDARDCALYLPTAFSPNGDGKNDLFRAVVHDNVSSFRLAVYGRWGQLIFESRNPDVGWDGTFRGDIMPAGHYVYMVTYTDSHGQDMKQTGTLVLVR